MLDSNEDSDIDYHVSSFSGGGACVAVGKLASGDYVVCHSRGRSVSISFTEREWAAFIAGVKAGEFDL